MRSGAPHLAIVALVASLGLNCNDVLGIEPGTLAGSGTGSAGNGGQAGHGGGHGGTAGATLCPSSDAFAVCDSDKLDDANACCVAGHDCDGGPCVDGRCQSVVWRAEQPNYAGGIVVAGEHVYGSDIGGAIHWATTQGSAMPNVTSVSTGDVAFGVRGLAADDEHVFFIGGSTTVVGRFSLKKQTVEQLSQTSNASTYARLAAGQSHIYFVDNGGVWRANKDLSDIAQAEVVWATAEARGVAVDATHVYWTELAALRRLALTAIGESPAIEPEELFATDKSQFTGALALDNNAIYWARGGTLHTLAKSAQTAVQVLATTTGTIEDIVVDDRNVYLTSLGGSAVRWVAKDGSGPPELRSDGVGTPGMLAQNCEAVFWLDADFVGDGHHMVWKLPK